MGKELYDAFAECKSVAELGSEILGFDIAKMMFEAEEGELSRTTVSQPAILTMSLMALEAAKLKGISANAVAGHSLGEYAAMAACGMLTYENAFKAIKYRSEAMDKVLGLKADDVAAVCKEIEDGGDYVTPVNYNSPVQTVIAGTTDGIAKAKEALAAKGAKRIVPLAVSAAFHSKLMNGAAEVFLQKEKDIPFNAPEKDFYCNVYGEKLTDFSDMPSYLAKHICSPVKFTSELAALSAAGYDTYIELGPGKVLTGLVKKTLDDVTAINIENLETLEKAENI